MLSEVSRAPVRGTWIEIYIIMILTKFNLCRAPVRGTWIEIIYQTQNKFGETVVPPYGARGLKFRGTVEAKSTLVSRAPVRGTWIEM